MPIFEGLRAAYHKAIEKHDNRSFLEATMATCALVANADGMVNFSERGRLDQIIHFVDRLDIYDPHEAVNLFNEYVDQLNSEGKTAKMGLLNKIKNNITAQKDKELLIKICWKICKADGEINVSERDAIEEIAHSIGLNFKDVFANY